MQCGILVRGYGYVNVWLIFGVCRIRDVLIGGTTRENRGTSLVSPWGAPHHLDMT